MVPVIPLLADEALPALRGSEFFSTQSAVVPAVLILGALALYLWGVKRVNRRYPRHLWPATKTAALIGALVATGIAIFSFIGVYDGELFWDHMIQHLILIMVAAPLYAASSPIDLAWRATTRRVDRDLTRALRSLPSRVLADPITAFLLSAADPS